MNGLETAVALDDALTGLRETAEQPSEFGADMASREYLLQHGLDFDAVASRVKGAAEHAVGRGREVGSSALTAFLWGFAVAELLRERVDG